MTIDLDTPLMRYTHLSRLREILRTRSLYLPVTTKYEALDDVNEGRFTDEYVLRIKAIQEYLRTEAAARGAQSMDDFQAALDELKAFDSDDLGTAVAWAMSARENSFVSCWTLGQDESSDMWQSFGDDGRGVAICSTVRRVNNELENVCHEESEYHGGEGWHLIDGPITYDRQDIHHYLGRGNVNHAFLIPLFFLDGGSMSFEHEKEFRFVAYNLHEIKESASDRLDDPAPPKGNYVRATGSTRRNVRPYLDHINVEISPGALITGVIVGPNIQPKDAAAIKKRVARLGSGIAVMNSSL